MERGGRVLSKGIVLLTYRSLPVVEDERVHIFTKKA